MVDTATYEVRTVVKFSHRIDEIQVFRLSSRRRQIGVDHCGFRKTGAMQISAGQLGIGEERKKKFALSMFAED